MCRETPCDVCYQSRLTVRLCRGRNEVLMSKLLFLFSHVRHTAVSLSAGNTIRDPWRSPDAISGSINTGNTNRTVCLLYSCCFTRTFSVSGQELELIITDIQLILVPLSLVNFLGICLWTCVHNIESFPEELAPVLGLKASVLFSTVSRYWCCICLLSWCRFFLTILIRLWIFFTVLVVYRCFHFQLIC